MKEKIEQRRRRKHRRLLVWLLFYILLFAAAAIFLYQEGKRISPVAAPSGQIVLSTSKNQYTMGDTVSFTIQNKLSSPIFINNQCPREPLNVYLWDGTSHVWSQIHETAKTDSCAGQQRQVEIAAGSSVTSNYADWPQLFSKPGIYRLVALMDNYSQLVYTDFDMVAKPTKPAPTYIIQQVPVYVPTPTTDGTVGGDN